MSSCISSLARLPYLSTVRRLCTWEVPTEVTQLSPAWPNVGAAPVDELMLAGNQASLEGKQTQAEEQAPKHGNQTIEALRASQEDRSMSQRRGSQAPTLEGQYASSGWTQEPDESRALQAGHRRALNAEDEESEGITGKHESGVRVRGEGMAGDAGLEDKLAVVPLMGNASKEQDPFVLVRTRRSSAAGVRQHASLSNFIFPAWSSLREETPIYHSRLKIDFVRRSLWM